MAVSIRNRIDRLHEELDRDDDNHQIRLMIADLLLDAGSPLHEGMRLLGSLARRPYRLPHGGYTWYRSDSMTLCCVDCDLPDPWYTATKDVTEQRTMGSDYNYIDGVFSFNYVKRRDAEETAAEGYARLHRHIKTLISKTKPVRDTSREFFIQEYRFGTYADETEKRRQIP